MGDVPGRSCEGLPKTKRTEVSGVYTLNRMSQVWDKGRMSPGVDSAALSEGSPAAKAADCKSATQTHRWFESNSSDSHLIGRNGQEPAGADPAQP